LGLYQGISNSILDGIGDMISRFWLIFGTISGFAVVALGAFGAHSLKDILNENGKLIYERAVLYHMFHSIALIAVGLLQKTIKEVSFAPAGWAFLVGIFLFSGSLYFLAVTGLKWIGAITPLGGTAFLFGWAWLIFALTKTRSY
jgi:uncharacterized membrane protein YgdD (TMEM256/DUF423 family)